MPTVSTVAVVLPVAAALPTTIRVKVRAEATPEISSVHPAAALSAPRRSSCRNVYAVAISGPASGRVTETALDA